MMKGTRTEQNRTEEVARIVVTLLNTEEDMLVFGSISSDWDLTKSPIGETSEGVLDAGITHDGILLELFEVGYGNDIEVGAVTLKTLTSAET